MSEEVHRDFDPGEKWHGTGFGCAWKHSTTEWVNGVQKPKDALKECDYRKNGYDVSVGRTSQYNGPHKQKAQVFDKDRVASEVRKRNEERSSKDSEEAWKAKWRARLNGSLGLLDQDPNAWYIDHTYQGDLIPWWGKLEDRKLQKAKAKNFLPLPHGGWHFYFPYKHNYHHLIPRGAFHDTIINGPIPKGKEDLITPKGRLKIAIHKDYIAWNINNKDNIILLPNEEIIAKIVGLPAHCPWDTRSHPKYTDMINGKLKEIRKAIDEAVGKKDHKKSVNAAKEKIKETQTELFDEVKGMRGTL